MSDEVYAGPMDFPDALRAVKAGQRAFRRGWNGKDMWIELVRPHIDDPDNHDGIAYSVRRVPCTKSRLLPWIGMGTADGGFVPWLASQTDLLADDWLTMSLFRHHRSYGEEPTER